jgi:PPK2 family polyphosphate:nucleotide phosphotransferase
MKLNTNKFRVKPGKKVKLRSIETQVKSLYNDTDDYEKELKKFQNELKALQTKLYASQNYSFLIVFQGMDTSGKDGAIAHVMSGVNPQGCKVATFKQPSVEELKHDFLWRTVERLPERGQIGIFNRSYYEDVLVTRVHKNILDEDMLPPKLKKQPHFWRDRFADICHHEAYLERQGTRVIKIFLHVSKKEQAKRLLARLDDDNKTWKVSDSDFRERKFWDKYQTAYEEALSSTSSKDGPWYIIPADDKKNARLIISKIILEELGSLDIHYPKVSKARYSELMKLRKTL